MTVTTFAMLFELAAILVELSLLALMGLAAIGMAVYERREMAEHAPAELPRMEVLRAARR